MLKELPSSFQKKHMFIVWSRAAKNLDVRFEPGEIRASLPSCFKPRPPAWQQSTPGGLGQHQGLGIHHALQGRAGAHRHPVQEEVAVARQETYRTRRCVRRSKIHLPTASIWTVRLCIDSWDIKNFPPWHSICALHL